MAQETQKWDDVLYPSFMASIRGTIYGFLSPNVFDEMCYNIARRAISAFKFPKVSLQYTTYWGVKNDETGELYIVDKNTPGAVPHAYFDSDEVSYNEIEIILAWMKVYWCEYLISRADNFDDMYTDVNIKTFSRANAVEKNTKLMHEFRDYAKDLENRYSRVNSKSHPSIGDVNEYELL